MITYTLERKEEDREERTEEAKLINLVQDSLNTNPHFNIHHRQVPKPWM
jgi:hypothetical protein